MENNIGCNLDLGHLCGLWWQQRSGTSAQTDLSPSRTMDLEIVFGNSPGPDVFMVTGGSTGHSDHHNRNMALEYQHSPR